MAAKTHVIELTAPCLTRPQYVRRQNRDGGFVITSQIQRARRFEPTSAAYALRDMQTAIELGGFTPTVKLAPAGLPQGAGDD